MNILTFALDTNSITLIVLGVLTVGLIGFYLYSSKRNKQRQAETMEMASKLAPGDKVQTIGGIVGEVVEVNHAENTVTIKTGTAVMVFDKQAVYSKGFFEAMENKGKAKETSQPEEVKTANEVYEDIPQVSDEQEKVVDRAQIEQKPKRNTKKPS